METATHTQLGGDLVNSDPMQRSILGVAQILLELGLVKNDGEDWKRAVIIAQHAVSCLAIGDGLDPEPFELIKATLRLKGYTTRSS